MEHTPLPWAWVEMPTYLKYDIQTGGEELILSFSGPVLEGIGGEGALGDWGALSISEADAAFIIRAVNNHYPLLAALEAIFEADVPMPPMIILQARNAIKLAKGD